MDAVPKDAHVLSVAAETPGPSTVNQWVRQQINLRGRGNGNIIFRGTVGTTFNSDIALDDITVREGSCEQVRDFCRGITLIHRSPSRPSHPDRPAVRQIAICLIFMSTLYKVSQEPSRH